MPEQVTRSIIVKADVGEVYGLWADFEHFPVFMQNINSVKMTGDRTSQWEMAGPLGMRIQWEAETTRLEPNKRIAWNSKANEGLTTSGQVTFNLLPQSGETEVTVTLQYVPPGGLPGEVVAQLFADPEGRLEEDLYNFKRYAERSGRGRADTDREM